MLTGETGILVPLLLRAVILERKRDERSSSSCEGRVEAPQR